MKKLSTLLVLLFAFQFTPAVLADTVNINTADAKSLQQNLRGIGEKKAKAIVAHRKEHGDFKSLEEIMEVRGIGKGIFKKIKQDITLNRSLFSGTSTADKTEKSRQQTAKSTTKKSTQRGDKSAEKKTTKKSVEKPKKHQQKHQTNKKQLKKQTLLPD